VRNKMPFLGMDAMTWVFISFVLFIFGFIGLLYWFASWREKERRGRSGGN